MLHVTNPVPPSTTYKDMALQESSRSRATRSLFTLILIMLRCPHIFANHDHHTHTSKPTGALIAIPHSFHIAFVFTSIRSLFKVWFYC